MQPCVYIVVPIYNVERFLKECIQSILSQSYQNIKVILIDDGSTDKSKEIAESFLSDLRVALISQENQGASSARNTGIDEVLRRNPSDNDFLIFLDSDDMMSENYIQSMLQVAQKDSLIDVLIGGVQSISEQGELLQKSKKHDETLILGGLEYLASIRGNYFAFVGGGGSKNFAFKREKNKVYRGHYQ